MTENIGRKQARTMMSFSYGLSTPRDLFSKVEREAQKLGKRPDPDDLFNFIITAYSLAEWIEKHYDPAAIEAAPFKKPKRANQEWVFPDEASTWVDGNSRNDVQELPVPPFHIQNVLQISGSVANASKHYYWYDGGRVRQIEMDPPPSDWHSYFFQGIDPGLCIDTGNGRYSVTQIASVLVSFYRGLLDLLDSESTGHFHFLRT